MHGSATLVTDFGDPTASDELALCVYDASGLATGAGLPAGGVCGTKPCWRGAPTSFKYKNRAGNPDGILSTSLKAGGDGKARIILKAKGSQLAMPSLGDIAAPVRVQLQSRTGACWETIHPTPFLRHDDTILQDKDG